MADTDLDALDYINRLANAAGRNVHELLAEIAKTAEAALRARLAPTHADDEMLIDNIRDGLSDDTYNYRGQIRRYADDLAALSQRLAELRARADELEKDRAKWRMEWRAELRARRAAERALAECRDKTIEDACAALKAKQAMLIDVGCDGPVVNAFSSAMGVVRALKTKEPRT